MDPEASVPLPPSSHRTRSHHSSTSRHNSTSDGSGGGGGVGNGNNNYHGRKVRGADEIMLNSSRRSANRKARGATTTNAAAASGTASSSHARIGPTSEYNDHRHHLHHQHHSRSSSDRDRSSRQDSRFLSDPIKEKRESRHRDRHHRSSRHAYSSSSGERQQQHQQQQQQQQHYHPSTRNHATRRRSSESDRGDQREAAIMKQHDKDTTERSSSRRTGSSKDDRRSDRRGSDSGRESARESDSEQQHQQQQQQHQYQYEYSHDELDIDGMDEVDDMKEYYALNEIDDDDDIDIDNNNNNGNENDEDIDGLDELDDIDYCSRYMMNDVITTNNQYQEDISTIGGGTINQNYGDGDDSDLEDLLKGDSANHSKESQSQSHRGNSPEPNPRFGMDSRSISGLKEQQHQQQQQQQRQGGVETMEKMNDVDANNCSNLNNVSQLTTVVLHADMAGGGVGGAIVLSNTPQQSGNKSQDPPDLQELLRPNAKQRATSTSLEPDQEFDPTLLNNLEIDAPPTPVGAERNNRRSSKTKSAGEERYSNYTLDPQGHTQYSQQSEQSKQMEKLKSSPPSLPVPDMNDEVSKRSARGQDPPEGTRGCDPTPTHIGSSDHPPYVHRSPKSHHRSRNKGRKVRKEDEIPAYSTTAVSTISASKKKEPEKKKEIKGILRKKGTAPPPIAYFGKPVSLPPGNDGGGSVSSGSDPSVFEKKTGNIAPLNHDDDVSLDLKSAQSAPAKSGLRSGRFAAANVAAAASTNQQLPISEDGDYSEIHDDADLDASSKASIDDSNDDENTVATITVNDNEKFDRAHSHFLRTADLGLTQDTIFAEQFLDDPNAKPEPHYHHPTPHPPPGVQFHIDENWISVDDGRGGHSPIAPQAVDALVAMGYRAACDPMMWTPTSKTRKYMTEKNLRFDDIPIPGPLDEGDGGPGDSTCLVWSGKFSHKYHGSELPATRSQGIVNMSPEELVDLLMNSNRVNEYNKSSIGRNDELVLSDGTNMDSCPFSGMRKKKLTGVVMDGARVVDGVAVIDSETDDERSDVDEEEEHVFDDNGNKTIRKITSHGTSGTRSGRKSPQYAGVTKLVRSTNKPPLVRKVLEFVTLLHCRALSDDQGGNGYIIVGRAITPAEDAEKDNKGIMRSEILLNVHIIRRLRTKKKSHDKGKKSSAKSVLISPTGNKAPKEDLRNRCLMINVNHVKSPMIPNLIAKKVGLSAAVNFISDIRQLTE